MGNETVLTDEQIAQALNDAGVTEYADVPLRYDLEVARAIEQAVLQSPEVQALIEALQEIAKYPATRDEEMSMNSARATARHALNKIGKP